MNNNQNLFWKALCLLDDYFSRMGGAARPNNMVESDIPLYVGYKLLVINGEPINESVFVNQEFLNAAEQVIEDSNKLLMEIGLSTAELIPFVLAFYDYADAKLNKIDKSKQWSHFGEYLRKRNA